MLVFLISNSSMCYILFTIRNYYNLEVAYAISLWMSLEAGKQLLCFAACFVMGILFKVWTMSMESSSKLLCRMDETFTVCQYEANNGRHRSGVVSA